MADIKQKNEEKGDFHQIHESFDIHKSLCNTETCLSPPVYNLVCKYGITSFGNNILTECGVMDWGKLTEIMNNTGDSEVSDNPDYYVTCVKTLAPIMKHILQSFERMSVKEFSASFIPYLAWTYNEQIFLRAYEILHDDQSASSAVLACLLLTASTEKVLGDFYLLNNKIVPHLVKDLIAAVELKQIFGTTTIKLLQVVMGSPLSLNLRNILWHGFVSPKELDKRYGIFFLSIIIAIGGMLREKGMPWNTVKRRGFIDFSSSSVLKGIFPDIQSPELIVLSNIFQKSTLILPIMKLHWETCLQKYSELRFGECLTLLIPQLEHLLRVLFVTVNHCPEKLLTAENKTHYLTLTEIFSDILVNGKENSLQSVLGNSFMELLFDIFVLPEGPRLRDRLSHGEADFFAVPQFLVIHQLSIAAAICLKIFSNNSTSFQDSYSLLLLSTAGHYRTAFHPFMLLKNQVLNLSCSLMEWDSHPLCEIEDLNSDDTRNEEVLKNETVYSCSILVEQAYNMEHLITKWYSYGEGLENFVNFLKNCYILTLYRPKIEHQIILKLRAIVDHAKNTSENVQKGLCSFFNAWRNKTLRKRQRSTYARLLNSIFTLYSGLYLTTVLILAHIPLINKASEWKDKERNISLKFINAILTYSENLNILTDPSKNRWNESSDKTIEFFTKVTNHCQILRQNIIN